MKCNWHLDYKLSLLNSKYDVFFILLPNSKDLSLLKYIHIKTCIVAHITLKKTGILLIWCTEDDVYIVVVHIRPESPHSFHGCPTIIQSGLILGINYTPFKFSVDLRIIPKKGITNRCYRSLCKDLIKCYTNTIFN